MSEEKGLPKEADKFLRQELGIDKEELKKLKKKLSKVATRAERGAETLFKLVSKNQYTLNVMIDRKSNILISMNAIIMSIIIGTVLKQLDQDPHLIFPVVTILITNMVSMTYAVLATRPEKKHGESNNHNVMFYGNFYSMSEEDYTNDITGLIYKGDELYRTIAKDTYYLGKAIERKFKLLRHSFNIFLIGIILSVVGFVFCYQFLG